MKIKYIVFIMILTVIIMIVNISFATNEEDSFEVTSHYFYNKKNNTVTVIINSNNELENTKPTWKLSANKREYKKVFSENMHYNTPVQDVLGNVIDIDLNITRNR